MVFQFQVVCPGAIKYHRIHAIQSAMAVIHNLIEKYSTPEVLCTLDYDQDNRFACDSQILGSLLKGSITMGIWPKPEPPYKDIVFQKLAAQLRDFKVLDVGTHHRGRFNMSPDIHGIKDLIEASITALEDAMSGLDIRDFLPRQTVLAYLVG